MGVSSAAGNSWLADSPRQILYTAQCGAGAHAAHTIAALGRPIFACFFFSFVFIIFSLFYVYVFCIYLYYTFMI
jgi:hypothetical protein